MAIAKNNTDNTIVAWKMRFSLPRRTVNPSDPPPSADPKFAELLCRRIAPVKRMAITIKVILSQSIDTSYTVWRMDCLVKLTKISRCDTRTLSSVTVPLVLGLLPSENIPCSFHWRISCLYTKPEVGSFLLKLL